MSEAGRDMLDPYLGGLGMGTEGIRKLEASFRIQQFRGAGPQILIVEVLSWVALVSPGLILE